MRIATAAWPMERLPSFGAWEAKLTDWVAHAQADLLVFPEYAGMEPCLTAPPPEDTPQAWLDHATRWADATLATHVDLAARHGVHILAGSTPVAWRHRIVNRAYLVDPTGRVAFQDKQIPTPWERTHTTLAPGEALTVFKTDLGRIGVLICHDAEFPPLARKQNCDVLLIPACTDGGHGAARVRNAARARALECGAVTVLSQTVGEVPGCCFLDTNRGRAGVYAPPDRGFPESGILAEGAPDRPGWVRADIDLAALRALRDGQGEVRIPGDWAVAQARAIRSR